MTEIGWCYSLKNRENAPKKGQLRKGGKMFCFQTRLVALVEVEVQVLFFDDIWRVE